MPYVSHMVFRYEIARQLHNMKALNPVGHRRKSYHQRRRTHACYSKTFGVTSITGASDCEHTIEKDPTPGKSLECVNCRFQARDKGIKTTEDGTGKRKRG
jgi:hypothetical protein